MACFNDASKGVGEKKYESWVRCSSCPRRSSKNCRGGGPPHLFHVGGIPVFQEVPGGIGRATDCDCGKVERKYWSSRILRGVRDNLTIQGDQKIFGRKIKIRGTVYSARDS